jgi:hypothetical protein
MRACNFSKEDLLSNPINLNRRPTFEKSPRKDSALEAALDGGRRVIVMAMQTTDPHVGDHVEITEHRHRTGRVTSWK